MCCSAVASLGLHMLETEVAFGDMSSLFAIDYTRSVGVQSFTTTLAAAQTMPAKQTVRSHSAPTLSYLRVLSAPLSSSTY